MQSWRPTNPISHAPQRDSATQLHQKRTLPLDTWQSVHDQLPYRQAPSGPGSFLNHGPSGMALTYILLHIKASTVLSAQSNSITSGSSVLLLGQQSHLVTHRPTLATRGLLQLAPATAAPLAAVLGTAAGGLVQEQRQQHGSTPQWVAQKLKVCASNWCHCLQALILKHFITPAYTMPTVLGTLSTGMPHP